MKRDEIIPFKYGIIAGDENTTVNGLTKIYDQIKAPASGNENDNYVKDSE